MSYIDFNNLYEQLGSKYAEVQKAVTRWRTSSETVQVGGYEFTITTLPTSEGFWSSSKVLISLKPLQESTMQTALVASNRNEVQQLLQDPVQVKDILNLFTLINSADCLTNIGRQEILGALNALEWTTYEDPTTPEIFRKILKEQEISALFLDVTPLEKTFNIVNSIDFKNLTDGDIKLLDQAANIYTNPETPKILKKIICKIVISPALRAGMIEYATARYGIPKDELEKIMPQGENFEFIGVGEGSFVTDETGFQKDISDKINSRGNIGEKPKLTPFGNSGWKYAFLQFPEGSGEPDKLYLCPPDTQNSGFVDTLKKRSSTYRQNGEPLPDDIKSAIQNRLPGLTKAHEIGKAIGRFKLPQEDAQTQQRFCGGTRVLTEATGPEGALQDLNNYHKRVTQATAEAIKSKKESDSLQTNTNVEIGESEHKAVTRTQQEISFSDIYRLARQKLSEELTNTKQFLNWTDSQTKKGRYGKIFSPEEMAVLQETKAALEEQIATIKLELQIPESEISRILTEVQDATTTQSRSILLSRKRSILEQKLEKLAKKQKLLEARARDASERQSIFFTWEQNQTPEQQLAIINECIERLDKEIAELDEQKAALDQRIEDLSFERTTVEASDDTSFEDTQR